MNAPHSSGATRVLAGAQLIQAGILLVQPPGLLRSIVGRRGLPPAWIMRLLGVRLAAQAAPEALGARPRVLRVGALIDLAHALSMLAAARAWPRYRRAALLSAGSAGVSAFAGALLARQRR